MLSLHRDHISEDCAGMRYFFGGPDGESLLCVLGFGMLYNHGRDPEPGRGDGGERAARSANLAYSLREACDLVEPEEPTRAQTARRHWFLDMWRNGPDFCDLGRAEIVCGGTSVDTCQAAPWGSRGCWWPSLGVASRGVDGPGARFPRGFGQLAQSTRYHEMPSTWKQPWSVLEVCRKKPSIALERRMAVGLAQKWAKNRLGRGLCGWLGALAPTPPT